MKIAGLVAEYNPFHNGHLAHIEATKAALGPDTGIICCMSGDFVQRGEAAQWSKTARAECAVRCGADVVFELPVQWSLSSARASRAGPWGCWTPGRRGLSQLRLREQERRTARARGRGAARPRRGRRDKGRARPRARATPSCASACWSASSARTRGVIETPNNILAVEYIKAIYERGSRIRPLAVERTRRAPRQARHGPHTLRERATHA